MNEHYWMERVAQAFALGGVSAWHTLAQIVREWQACAACHHYMSGLCDLGHALHCTNCHPSPVTCGCCGAEGCHRCATEEGCTECGGQHHGRQ